MPPIGETLREARMRQRLDIADVEERTKIRAKYLRALENEEWGLLPGPTFVKTFLRTYAEVVGVDPYLLVEEYRLTEEAADAPDFQPLAPVPARERARGRGSRRQQPRPPRRGGMIAVAAIVVVVGFLLLLGLLGEDDSGDGGDDRAATTERQATSRQQRPRQQAERQQPRPAPSGVNLRIAPIEPTYVCVDNGAGTPVAFEGTLDGARAFRNPETVRINLGKRSAAVALNGEAVAVRESAEPLALEATRDGTTELDAAEAPCA